MAAPITITGSLSFLKRHNSATVPTASRTTRASVSALPVRPRLPCPGVAIFLTMARGGGSAVAMCWPQPNCRHSPPRKAPGCRPRSHDTLRFPKPRILTASPINWLFSRQIPAKATKRLHFQNPAMRLKAWKSLIFLLYTRRSRRNDGFGMKFIDRIHQTVSPLLGLNKSRG